MKNLLKKFLRRFGYALVPHGTIAMDVRQMRNLAGLIDAYERIHGVRGSVVECGVGRGRTFLHFAFLIESEGSSRALWGFDSFEGFPEPSPEDSSDRNPMLGEWKGTSADDIRAVLRAAGISPGFMEEKVHLVPGFFESSLSSYDGNPIALLHVDADLYQSYKEVLEVMAPLVSLGGIVLFDEYGEARWPGATQAVNEFLSGTSWKLERAPYSGKYYFVKR